MARNSRRRRNPALDLFGEVPVTWPEVWAWVEKVTGFGPDTWRGRYYAINWNVADKIRREKLSAALRRTP